MGFAPLIVAIRGQSPRRALLLGRTAGLAMVLLGLYWLVSTLRLFTRLSLPACVAVVLLVVAAQASRLGLFAWLAKSGQRRGWPFAPPRGP